MTASTLLDTADVDTTDVGTADVDAAVTAAPDPARSGCRPRLVVRPAPRREPPFDDEIDAPVATRHDQWLPFATPDTRPRPAEVTRPAGLPDPRSWSRRLLVGLVESADGRRPLHQLAALLSPSIHRGLAADFERTGAERATHWLRRAAVQNVRGCEPAPGVAEVCATLSTGGRVRAVALRLEQHHGHWVCMRLQLG